MHETDSGGKRVKYQRFDRHGSQSLPTECGFKSKKNVLVWYAASFLFEQSENLLEKVYSKGSGIFIDLYTNSDRYAKYNKRERIKARGILTEAVKITDEMYSFRFVDEFLSN